MVPSSDVMVIGAGVAGMKASLLLASAGRRVHLVESTSMIGGRLIRCEDIFPAMECATCMVSPMQQEVLASELINVITLGDIESIEGSKGDFRVTILKKASCVDPVACIGCAECWMACPVSVPNGFEENLSSRKAISVPCSGALPNVPWIDREHCVRWAGGEECSLCAEACVFGAVDYTQEDTRLDLNVSHIVLASGFEPNEGSSLDGFGWGGNPGVFTATEFERYYASNGPTDGKLVLKDGRTPASAGIVVHACGIGDYSHINTMYSLKFLHYIGEKLPEVEVIVFLDGRYSPDPVVDRYHSKWSETGAKLVTYGECPLVEIGVDGKTLKISCTGEDGAFESEVEMLVLGTSILPSKGTLKFIGMLDLENTEEGFPLNLQPDRSSVSTVIPGIYVAGCAAGPADIASSVVQASAAAGRILSDLNREAI